MSYDRSWMGYGFTGAFQVCAIALAVGFVLFGILHLAGKRLGWPMGVQLSWAFLLTMVLAGGTDGLDLFYFDFAPIHSITLLKLKLAEVHDPDSIGLRFFFEIVGAVLGVAIGWTIFTGDLRERIGLMRRPRT